MSKEIPLLEHELSCEAASPTCGLAVGITSADSVHDLWARSQNSEWDMFHAAAESPAQSVFQDLPASFVLWLLVNMCAVLVYIVRCVAVGSSEGFLPGAFATTYLAIGVLLPSWSLVVGHSAPVSCILVHREYYKALDATIGDVRLLMASGAKLGPICNLLALVAPLHVCLLVRFSYEQQARELYSTTEDNLKLVIFAVTMVGLAGMIIFSSAKSVDIVVNASTAAINGLIYAIRKLGNDNTGSADIDTEKSRSTVVDFDTGGADIWEFQVMEGDNALNSNRLQAHVNFVDAALRDVWSVKCVGGPWLMRVSLLFVASFACLAYSIDEQHKPIRNTLRVVGMLLAAGGLFLLLRLAVITSLCQSQGSKACSVLTAAHASVRESQERFLRRMEVMQIQKTDPLFLPVHAERQLVVAEQQHLLSLLSECDMGIHLCGTTVTYSLVISIASKVLVYVPVGLGIVGRLLHPDSQYKEAP